MGNLFICTLLFFYCNVKSFIFLIWSQWNEGCALRWRCRLWPLPPDASAAAAPSPDPPMIPAPWIMHEIRVQITPINMQSSLSCLNCHLIVLKTWKMSGTLIAHLCFYFPLFFLNLIFTWNEFDLIPGVCPVSWLH